MQLSTSRLRSIISLITIAKSCRIPRFFEWNMMNHGNLDECCMDIDGVICTDPLEEENDDGPRYVRFLRDATPISIPNTTVGWLVTCRLEKYRALTEEWLARHGVRYHKLVMLDLPSKEARMASNCHGRFKADVYKRTEASLFIESSLTQAAEIARIARKPVCCITTCELIQPERLARIWTSVAILPKRLTRKLPSHWRRKLIEVRDRVWKTGLEGY